MIKFASVVSNAPDAAFAAQLGECLDLDEFARLLAVTVLLSNMDSILAMGQNYYVYLHPESNKFQFLPWVLDFGGSLARTRWDCRPGPADSC